MPSSEIAPASLSITLLGPLQVRVNGHLLPPLRSRKPLWLLVLLILRYGRPVEREWLAGTLWPDSDQSRAFANLRPVLSELRQALTTEGTRLQSPGRHTLMLDLTDAEVDLLQFDAALASGQLSELEQAVALYRGPLLEGCNEEWIVLERAAREQGYLHALQKLGEASLAGEEYGAAANYYHQMVRTDPWQEGARRGWMEALAQNGDTNAALQVYREFVEFLKVDPRATPDAQTSALYQRLRAEVRQRVGTHVVVTTEAIAIPKVQGYLSHALTELVGREDERLEVALLLRRSRLVTLTGMGGIGKTRLAREVASEVVKEYPEGVWLVALESLTERRQVIQQIASVLGLREERGRTPLQRVTEHLRAKRLLLVLDNCEHLLGASAEVVGHLLAECGELRILATSREALGITGETVWSVPALTVPDMEHLPEGRATLLRVLTGYESVQLFVERAQAVQKGFALTGSNAQAVAQICQQLEGIPLAIELAAARVRAMSVDQIASRLDDYPGLLTVGSRTAQSRQQTLRATLDWSYDLLTQSERLLLKRLSVFAGGCLLEAAEQVCRGEGVDEGQVLDLLTSLVDKSLVLFEVREGEAGGRYRLLEMVRQYAAEALHKSGEIEKIKRKHRDWFLAFAEAAEPQLKGAEQIKWLQRLETEHDNLRSALDWSETQVQGAEAGLRLAGALHQFWYIRGDFNAGRAYLGRALEREGAQEATLARTKALHGAGDLAYYQGDYASTRALNEESLTISRELGDKGGIANSLNSLGEVACEQGNYDAARTLLQESLEIQRDLRDRWGIGNTLNNLGVVVYYQGDYVTARTLYEESLAIRRELGDQGGIAATLSNLGNMAYSHGDYVTARTLFEESLAIYRESGDRRSIANILNCLGGIAHSQGDYEEAKTLFVESLAIRRELGDQSGIATSLNNLGGVIYFQRDYATARTLWQESLAILRTLGDRRSIAQSLNNLGGLAYVKGDYDTARTLRQEYLAMCRELGDQSGIIHALGLLGQVAREVGDYAQASTLYQERISLRQKVGDGLAAALSLEDFAHLAGRQEQWARAARLLGAAEVLGAPQKRPLPVGMAAEIAAEYERTVATMRAALSEEAFATAWEEGRAMTLEQAVHYALEA